MVLNGGTFEGRRLLRAETVKLMHTSVLEPGVEVTLTSQFTRGLGFGLDFAIVQDPAAAGTGQATQFLLGRSIWNLVLDRSCK